MGGKNIGQRKSAASVISYAKTSAHLKRAPSLLTRTQISILVIHSNLLTEQIETATTRDASFATPEKAVTLTQQ
jgi:hypothetical protein